MPNRAEVEIEKDYRRWKERLTDPDFRKLPFTKQGREIGVSPTTISKWHKELTPAQWENIRKMTIEQVAPQSVKINDALYQKCLEGDVQAIKLWKESIEGWVPRQDMGLSRARDKELDAIANDELVRMLIKDWPKEKKMAILEGGPGVESQMSLEHQESHSVDPGESVEPLKLGREPSAEEELKELTGGDVGEWPEGTIHSGIPKPGFTKEDFRKK